MVTNCMNGVREGSETDVDCGGGICAKCALGQLCLQPADCATNKCTNNRCSAPPLALGFSGPTHYSMMGTSPNYLAIADFNGDGKPDVSLVTDAGINVYLGNGNGTFQATQLTGFASLGNITTADFNGDGKLDAVG